jgi:hypothetical protein
LEDQEVIVFFDERVKEFEKVVEELKSREATMKKESYDIVNKNEKKSRVLSDILRFERGKRKQTTWYHESMCLGSSCSLISVDIITTDVFFISADLVMRELMI